MQQYQSPPSHTINWVSEYCPQPTQCFIVGVTTSIAVSSRPTISLRCIPSMPVRSGTSVGTSVIVHILSPTGTFCACQFNKVSVVELICYLNSFWGSSPLATRLTNTTMLVTHLYSLSLHDYSCAQ